MPAVKELERPAGVLAGVPECSAMIPLILHPDDFPELMRCPEPPAAEVEGRCRCGHARSGWLCTGHEQLLGQSGCRACIEDEENPHDCLLTVRRVGEVGHG